MKRSILTALLVAVIATGCQAQETGPAAPKSTASPSESPTPTVVPATGNRMRMKPFTFRMPAGYKAKLQYGGLVGGGYLDGNNIAGVYFPSLGGSEDLDALVRVARTSGTWSHPPKRLPDVTVDGVEMYVLTARGGCCHLFDTEYGTSVGGNLTSLQFSLSGKAGERQETIDSVIATVRWR